MSDLYLIAHKVRGEPAFDVATRMECPECIIDGQPKIDDNGDYAPCVECDNEGFWWIVPTSGHRAYPWWSEDLAHYLLTYSTETGPLMLHPSELARQMPPSLPDHYTTHAAPSRPKLAELLRVPSQPVHRRF